MIFLPVIQQSKSEDQALSAFLQFFVPHFKLPAQSESVSQSPSPAPQGFEEVQQFPSFLLASHLSKTSQKLIKTIEREINVIEFLPSTMQQSNSSLDQALS